MFFVLNGKHSTFENTGIKKSNSIYAVVPYDNPQLVIYCVVNQPNTEDQAHSYYAQNIVREILEEVLPYMNIYPDEELTGKNADLGITGNNPPSHSFTNGAVEETPQDDTIEQISGDNPAETTQTQPETTQPEQPTGDTPQESAEPEQT